MRKSTNTGSTSSFSDEIHTTVKELKRVLGEPSYEEPSMDDKVSIEWELETDDGIPFTVYDWKQYSKPAAKHPNTKYHFHIGARSEAESNKVKIELKKLLKS